MKLKLSVDQSTSPSELIILGAFFESLALAREGHVVSTGADIEPKITAPTDPAELQEPETVVVPPAAGEEAPKRKRRTKAEIEAANLPPEPPVQETEPPAPTEPEQVPAVETPAPTPDVQPQVTPQSETASTAPASASPSEPEAFEVAAAGGKTYAAADVQQLATVVARTHGADLVKGKIAELGGTRIADLKQEQLNALGTFLAGVK